MHTKNLDSSFRTALAAWYRKNARKLPWRENASPYSVWVSEIMLQQTRVEAVRHFHTRFLAALPDISALAAAPEDLLLKLWEGLGYYSRVRNMQKTARIIQNDFGGIFPSDVKALLSLPGIGPYTAGAVSSIAFYLPAPAVDGNVLRVFSRLLEIQEIVTTPAVKKTVTEILEKLYPAKKDKACSVFTQSLMELGATVCLPNTEPKCGECPVSDYCRAHKNNRATDYPKTMEKKKRKIQKLSVFLFYCDGKLALRKRENSGLLAGLWELPNCEAVFSEKEAAAYAESLHTAPHTLLKKTEKKHIFTHIEWHMHGYSFLCGEMPDTFTWVSPQALAETYALPTAFRQFLE